MHTIEVNYWLFEGGTSRVVNAESISMLPYELGVYTQTIEFALKGRCYDPEQKITLDEQLPFTVFKTISFIIE